MAVLWLYFSPSAMSHFWAGVSRPLTTILPAMTLTEAFDTTRIPSVAGLTGDRTAFVMTRPCRAPHLTLSDVGLIRGGYLRRPGEVPRAHHGPRGP